METDLWIKSIIRCVMCITGIIGNNWLCLSSLPKSISQLRSNDILFVNLGVSNLITNYFVDILNIFHTERYIPLGKLYCSIRFFLPEFSETSSILTTMFITTYWHQKLVGSLKRGGGPVQMENLRFITVLLTGSWTFSLVLNVPHLFFVVVDSENTTAEDCMEEMPSQEAEQAYEVVYVTLANALPLSGILYATIKITNTLLQNKKRMRKTGTAVQNEGNAFAEKRVDDNNSNNASRADRFKTKSKSASLMRATKSVVAVALFFLTCWVFHEWLRKRKMNVHIVEKH